MLINNYGYVVKAIYDHCDLTQHFGNYRGIGTYTSWPLKYLQGYNNIEEEMEPLFITNKYDTISNMFGSAIQTLEFIRDESFIKRYVSLCNSVNIPTIIMRIDLELPIIKDESEFIVEEVLGWDCVAQSYFSYIDELDTLEKLASEKFALNKNGLFESITDVKRFIKIRTELIQKGYYLEDAFIPIPARISIVVMSPHPCVSKE